MQRLDWLLSDAPGHSQTPGWNCPTHPASSEQDRARPLIAASECGALVGGRRLPKRRQKFLKLLPTPKRRQTLQTELVLARATGISVGTTLTFLCPGPSINSSLLGDAEQEQPRPAQQAL